MRENDGRAALARFIRAAQQRVAPSGGTVVVIRGGLEGDKPERRAWLPGGVVLHAADGEPTETFRLRVAAAARQAGAISIIYGGLPE